MRIKFVPYLGLVVMIFILVSGCDYNLPGQPTLPALVTDVSILPTENIEPLQTTVSTMTCNNSYWPIEVGATWTYDILDMSRTNLGIETTQITDVYMVSGTTYFNLHVKSVYQDTVTQYYCSSNGSIYDAQGILFLPSPSEMIPDGTWGLGNGGGESLKLIRFEDVSVPAGNFYSALFTIIPGAYKSEYWSEGIGLVRISGDISKELTSYTITSTGINDQNIPETVTFNESNVRYIMADIQLGNVADYYRQFTDQPDVAEALLRWDTGYRVTNISSFERKIIGDLGWQVVFAGTEKTIAGTNNVIEIGIPN